jgi:hypothetical protein
MTLQLAESFRRAAGLDFSEAIDAAFNTILEVDLNHDSKLSKLEWLYALDQNLIKL